MSNVLYSIEFLCLCRDLSMWRSALSRYCFGDSHTTKMGALRAQDGRGKQLLLIGHLRKSDEASPDVTVACWGCLTRTEKPYRPFRIELGNEEACSPEFVSNVARVATAMVGRARKLKLPFKLMFAVGGPYEVNELTDRAMAPMVQACRPLANHSNWLWDFHINGDSANMVFELHKEPWTRRSITNADYHQMLIDNFTRWDRFFRGQGNFFKCGNFEQNGGRHDMSRALGNARNSVTLQGLGDIVRMSTGANALQLMGHNDNGAHKLTRVHYCNVSITFKLNADSGVCCLPLSYRLGPRAAHGSPQVRG